MDGVEDWTNATGRALPSDARSEQSPPGHMVGHVLDPAAFLRRARYDHAVPAPPLRRWIDRYWSVTWRLPAGAEHAVTTLDDPAVHLTREWGGIRREGVDGAGTWITGPLSRGRFEMTQHGTGGVVGVRFRLGGTTAFSAAEPAAVRDRTVPAADWFDAPAVTTIPADLPENASGAAAVLDAWLLSLAPRDAPGYEEFIALLALIEDPEVTGTAELERRSGHGARDLQRRFHRFVGVGPKRMIMRSRVMDAVAALDGGDQRTVAQLSQDLGWYDQPHFVRDFRAVTGTTPSAYARTHGDRDT